MTLANTTYELPENGVLATKHVGVIYYKFHCLFVHMLVYNKQLLFNMHGVNIKISVQTDIDREGSCVVTVFI
jgi:hypothetical protein